MVDRVVRTTHNSFLDRIIKSLVQLAAAPLLMILAYWYLVYNEEFSIKQHDAVKEGIEVAVDLYEDVDAINTSNNEKLIHFSGTAKTDSPVFDNIFSVVNENDTFLKIQRKVEMYQWYEQKKTREKKNLGGSSDTITTYTYTKEWKSYPISSSSFQGDSRGHENPEGGMLYQNAVFVADAIHIGDFLLSTEIVQKMNWWQSFPTSLTVDSILDDSARATATVYGDAFYFGAGTQDDPQIGDTRVTFKVVPSQVVSIVAKQTGKRLSTYYAKKGGSID